MIRENARRRLEAAASAVEQRHADQIDPAALDGWLVVDVREDHEYAAGHLPGALSLPRSRLEMDAMKSDALDAASDRPVLVYCGGGTRSLLAAHTLSDLGVSRPVSMDGGFRAWSAAGKPVTRES